MPLKSLSYAGSQPKLQSIYSYLEGEEMDLPESAPGKSQQTSQEFKLRFYFSKTTTVMLHLSHTYNYFMIFSKSFYFSCLWFKLQLCQLILSFPKQTIRNSVLFCQSNVERKGKKKKIKLKKKIVFRGEYELQL